MTPRTLVVLSCVMASSAVASPLPPRPTPAKAGTAGKAPAPPPPKPRPAVTPAPAYTGLGADSVSAADIARFAPPALDGSITRRIQTMLDVRGAGPGVLTRKADRMFFNWRVTGTTQVWRQDGAMRLPVQLTGGEDNTSVQGVAPDDSFVVVARDIGGQENPGLYLLDPEGGPLVVVQHEPKVQTTLAFISDDSKSIYYRANDITPDAYAIYRFDVKARRRELVFDQPGLWSVADRRGDEWLLVKNLGNTQQEVYQYDLATKQLVPLLGQGEVEQYRVAFGARRGQVLVQTNKLGDHHRVYSLEQGRLTPISPEVTHDVQSFAIDEARKRIYIATNVQGYSRLAVYDARTLRPQALPKLQPADHTTVGGLSRDGRFAQFTVSGARLPQTPVVYDWQTRKVTTWRVPEAPEVDVKTFATHTIEHYPARDGAQIPIIVRRPATCAADPCPVIVQFHGGPESQARPGFSPIGQLYVDAGFVFVEPNVRGSSGYGKAWMHADDGPRRLDVITDIEDAARFIRTAWAKQGVAPRLGVVGGSYGGYSALMAMTYFAGAYDAGVALYSISSLETFLMNTAPYRRILRVSEYGDPVKDRAALRTLSPMTHVSKLRSPLLLVQGVNDPRTPAGEAIAIYRELERRRIPSGLILFADEGHGASKRSNQVLQIGHTIAFFEKHLLGK
jgi:dipeptidyl aminopeptidase/acylaminoacyl peptidase